MNFDELLEPSIFPILVCFVCGIAAIIGTFGHMTFKVHSDNTLKRDSWTGECHLRK